MLANRVGCGAAKAVSRIHALVAVDALYHLLLFEDAFPKVTVASTDDESFFVLWVDSFAASPGVPFGYCIKDADGSLRDLTISEGSFGPSEDTELTLKLLDEYAEDYAPKDQVGQNALTCIVQVDAHRLIIYPRERKKFLPATERVAWGAPIPVTKSHVRAVAEELLDILKYQEEVPKAMM